MIIWKDFEIIIGEWPTVQKLESVNNAKNDSG